MASISRLGRQLAEVIGALNGISAPYALIGGLALATHKVIRATQDIDLLTGAEKAQEVEAELAKLGYRCLHRSADAGNYLRGDERVDFLYASRPAARRNYRRSSTIRAALGTWRIFAPCCVPIAQR